jgi:hypothetical protein
MTACLDGLRGEPVGESPVQINLIADASVGSAPAGFTAAVEAAAEVYDNLFAGDYTVNITYGWGTFDNQPDNELAGAQVSLGGSENNDFVSYATLKTWLTDDAALPDQQAAVASLPQSYTALPGDADDFLVSSAEEKALGVYTGANDALIDGSIGFGTGLSGDSDSWEGLALCEIGHALGWLTGYTPNTPTVLDLFRFSSAGQRQWSGGQSAYFSLNDGASDLGNFATSFDYTLFTGPSGDAFFAPIPPNTDTLSGLDQEVLNVLGFGGKSAAGPQITISEHYALPGSNEEIVSGTIDAGTSQYAISLGEGSTELASSNPQTGGHWALAVTLSAGQNALTAKATNETGATGASDDALIQEGDDPADVYADTAADLAALTADEIAALAQSGVTQLRSTDATLAYNSAQSAEIESYGMSVAAPAGDRVREALANGDVLLYFYSANGALSRVATYDADGTLDRRVFGVTGAMGGASFTSFDVFVDATGAAVQKLFLDAQGAVVATKTFTTDGFSLYVDGALNIKRTPDGNGSFDVFRYDLSERVGGMAFDSIDVSYLSNGVANSCDYYDAGVYLGSKIFNSDKSSEFISAALSGRAYTNFQNANAQNGALLGQSYDYDDNTGALYVFGSGLDIDATGKYGPASAPADFIYTRHLNETYTLASGADDDTLAFDSDFGNVAIYGFSSAADDVVNLSQVFFSYATATAAMTSSNGDVIFKDVNGDVLTLIGVNASSLSASRLGLA